MRTVPLWVGKTDDEKVPPRVRLRIFERHGGRCHLSGRKIMPGEPWDLDHIKALWKGGTHSEDNMAPCLRDKHREKSASEQTEQAKADRTRAKHLGIKNPKGPKLQGRGFQKWSYP